MRYVVGLSVASIALATGCIAKSPPENTREQVIAFYGAVLKAWDRDGDGKLSRAEVTAMVDEFIRRAREHTAEYNITPDLETRRQELLGFYASQDTNHDNYLTLGELLKKPLADFDCADQNHDGRVSREEVFNTMGKCPSTNLDDYAPKP